VIPLRKTVLYLVDVSSGKLYPVKVTVLPDGTALLPISLEKDTVGLATESTLSGIKSKLDSILLDEAGRVYIHDPSNLDIKLSSWTQYISKLTNLDELDIPLSLLNTTLQSLSDKLPSSLTSLGNLKVAILEHYSSSITLAAPAARTTSGNSGDIDVGPFIGGEVCIDVTSVSGGNPSLDVFIEGKDQLSGKYKELGSKTGITTTGTFWITLSDVYFRYIRASWIISGISPSFTFSIGMEAKA
jgi:hypothetical protein